METAEVDLSGVYIDNEVYGSHHGQTDGSLYVMYDKDTPIAKLDYSIFQGEIYVKWIETHKSIKRKGMATKLLDYFKNMAEENGLTINYGMSTPDGTELLNSYRGVTASRHIYSAVEYLPVGEDEFELAGQAYDLAAKSPINILRDKEVNTVAVEDGIVIGALFTSFVADTFSFDVVVEPTRQRQGIGRELINQGMQEYQYLKSEMPEIDLKLDVVNPMLQDVMKRRGLEEKYRVNDDRIIMGALGDRVFQHFGVWQYRFDRVKKDPVEGYYLDWFDNPGSIHDISKVEIGDQVADQSLNMTPYWEISGTDEDKGRIYVTPLPDNPLTTGVRAGGHTFTEHDFEVYSGEYEQKRIDETLDVINQGIYTGPKDVAYILLGTVPVNMGPNGAQGGWYSLMDLRSNRGGQQGMTAQEIMMKDAQSLKKLGLAVPQSSLDGTLPPEAFNHVVDGGLPYKHNFGDTSKEEQLREMLKLEGEDWDNPQAMSNMILSHPQPGIKQRNWEELMRYYYGLNDKNKERIKPLIKQTIAGLAQEFHPKQKEISSRYDPYEYIKQSAITFSLYEKWPDILALYENTIDTGNRGHVAESYGTLGMYDRVMEMEENEQDPQVLKKILYALYKGKKSAISLLDRNPDKYRQIIDHPDDKSVTSYHIQELADTPVWMFNLEETRKDEMMQIMELMGGALLSVKQYLAKRTPTVGKSNTYRYKFSQVHPGDEWFQDPSGRTFWGKQGSGTLFVRNHPQFGPQLLAVLRSEHVEEPNTWGTSGGAVPRGETDLMQSALRETEEELGSLPSQYKVLRSYVWQQPGGTFKFTTFIIEVLDQWEPESSRFNYEVTDAIWTNMEESQGLDLHFGLSSILNDLQENVYEPQAPEQPAENRIASYRYKFAQIPGSELPSQVWYHGTDSRTAYRLMEDMMVRPRSETGETSYIGSLSSMSTNVYLTSDVGKAAEHAIERAKQQETHPVILVIQPENLGFVHVDEDMIHMMLNNKVFLNRDWSPSQELEDEVFRQAVESLNLDYWEDSKTDRELVLEYVTQKNENMFGEEIEDEYLREEGIVPDESGVYEYDETMHLAKEISEALNDKYQKEAIINFQNMAHQGKVPASEIYLIPLTIQRTTEEGSTWEDSPLNMRTYDELVLFGEKINPNQLLMPFMTAARSWTYSFKVGQQMYFPFHDPAIDGIPSNRTNQPNPEEEHVDVNEELQELLDTEADIDSVIIPFLDKHDIDYDWHVFPTGKQVMTIETPERIIVEQAENGLFVWNQVSDWLYHAEQYSFEYYPETDESEEFWSGVTEGFKVYHGTYEDRVADIQAHGLEARDETRGINNRGTGAAVFASLAIEAAEEYYPHVFAIDLGAMKAAEYMPRIGMETPIEEYQIRQSLAAGIGEDDYHEDVEQGLAEDTVVIYGGIPPQFLELVQSTTQ